MPIEGWNGKPVQVVECENSYGFLVTDGHKRVCAAARNGESVPIAVIQKDWNGEKHEGQYWYEV